ncbi:MAG: hypothetical protein IT293_10935 [Deltaproteobacteria bacterium]|nr:hypothetical protein [Deltaproteobacteria bacterium]
MRTTTSIVTALALLSAAVGAAPAAAKDFAAPALVGDRAEPGLMVQEPPRYGVFYDAPEPSFYTGFAPRTQDPASLHVHLGRGNQLRVTEVLSEAVVREYARDLAERRRAYRALVDEGRLQLTQNTAFEDFERRLDAVGLERMTREEATLAPDALRARNLDLIETLNPGRVFRIAIPVRKLVADWVRELDRIAAGARARLDAGRKLDVLNALLPTRLWLAEMPADAAPALDELVRRAPANADDAAGIDALVPAYTALLTRVGDDRYPVRDGVVRFAEFTAIYPVGSVAAYTTWRGRPIPQYPTPGRRALTNHQRSLVADHIPIDDSYSWSPWLPYMHVTPTMHNAIHTPWWKMGPGDAKFLPASWQKVTEGSRDGAPFKKLWLLSRGPMSHGCTHLNTGHIAELRQILPADGDRLYDVDVFLTRSEDYDVFDIDGDLVPEVMGVRYFIAYSLTSGKPDRLRVKNERRAFYDWLYGGDLQWEGDRGVFRDARDARFVGRDAREGRSYARVALREAPYQPETVQFYRMVDIPFARALRQVGLHQRAPGALDGRQASNVRVMRVTAEDGATPHPRRRAR